MSRPTVSVVVAVRDGERYLAESLESVLGQDPAPDQVVVVDDGSTDGTNDVLVQFGAAVHVVRQGPLGQAHAFNRGVAESTSDLVGFCDADDLWAPHRLARQLDALAEHPHASAVGGLLEQFESPDTPGAASGVRMQVVPEAAMLLATLLIRRETFDRLGLFDTQYEIHTGIDWVALLRAAGLEIPVIDNVVLRRRIHGENLGIRRPERARTELLRVARGAYGRRVGID